MANLLDQMSKQHAEVIEEMLDFDDAFNTTDVFRLNGMDSEGYIRTTSSCYYIQIFDEVHASWNENSLIEKLNIDKSILKHKIKKLKFDYYVDKDFVACEHGGFHP